MSKELLVRLGIVKEKPEPKTEKPEGKGPKEGGR